MAMCPDCEELKNRRVKTALCPKCFEAAMSKVPKLVLNEPEIKFEVTLADIEQAGETTLKSSERAAESLAALNRGVLATDVRSPDGVLFNCTGIHPISKGKISYEKT